MPSVLESPAKDVRSAAALAFSHWHSGRERPGRYWKRDLEALTVDNFDAAPAELQISNEHSGISVTPFNDFPDSVLAEIWPRIETAKLKFGALALSRVNGGVLIDVTAQTHFEEPLCLNYDISDRSSFPITIVRAQPGAQVDVIETISGDRGNYTGIVILQPAAGARIRYTALQNAHLHAQVLATRLAFLDSPDASVHWCAAELGADLSVSDIHSVIEATGADVQTAGLFFPTHNQYVDMVTTAEHHVGQSRSETVLRSAAAGHGQARYLGNIRITAGAHGTQAHLKDDALLLSQTAHIDSVPALEIAANDVKAFHGATVGAIDEEQIFYMTTRGLDRESSQRMISIGFFEPVIDRFPTSVREIIHDALGRKVRS